MTSWSQSALRLGVVFVLLAGFPWGCSLPKPDPATKVTVVITGLSDEAIRDEIQETLKGMVDGSSYQMRSQWTGDTMSVELSPVDDVDAFIRKINFGKVTAVNGRNIQVEYVK